MQKLNDICFCEKKTNLGDEFVGIRCIKSSDEKKCKTEICFPMGYFKDDVAIRTLPEEKVRESVMNLFSVLSDVDLMSNIHEDSSIAIASDNTNETAFPMLAYLNVIRNYLDNGYITEREVEFKKKAHGKVNWNRTIKMTRPVVTDDDENLVYLDLIARKVSYNEDCLITLVHKFCVHDALNRLGFLFGIEPTEEPVLDFDYELFCSAVNAKLSKTFNDRDLHLLADLAKIIEFLAEHQTEDGVNTDFYFGVNTFAPVWEAMVDKIFGNLPQGVDRDKFNPHLKWNGAVINVECEEEKVLNDPKRSTLRPDTIMVAEIPDQAGNDKMNRENDVEGVYVLDSKYYKFGLTKNRCHLPGAESVCKQMAYAEYVETKWKDFFGEDVGSSTSPKPIFNAFVMPYCADAVDSIATPSAALQNDYWSSKMKFEGYIYGDWKDGSKPYHRIACILLDVKSVMENYSSSVEAQKALSSLI